MRTRRNRRQMMIMGGTIAGVVLLVIIIILGRKLYQTSKALGILQADVNANQQVVYVANTDIQKGEQVTEDNIAQQKIYTGLESSKFMTIDDIGMRAVVDIAANDPIMKNMVTSVEIADDSRIYEVLAAHLMLTQAENDVVDVRILFPNGEDYLLLSKKTIMNLSLSGSSFNTYMNEDEILRFASAMVDAYTTTGTKIYTVQYVESNMQSDGIPNYPVKATVLDLINNDPNIIDKAEQTLNLDARYNLESRLGNLSSEQLEAMAAGLNLQDTAAASVLTDQANTDMAYDEYTVGSDTTNSGEIEESAGAGGDDIGTMDGDPLSVN